MDLSAVLHSSASEEAASAFAQHLDSLLKD